MNNKIFISGRVTGDPDNKIKFKAAEATLLNSRSDCRTDRPCIGCVFHDRNFLHTCRIYAVFPLQLEVVNPTSLGLEGRSWLYCMFVCIRKLRHCDYVFMLRDWRQSRGARWEHRAARWLNKNIIYQK